MSNIFSCGQCHFEANVGVHVCRGCGGDVVYGATADEKKQGLVAGALLGLFVSFAVLDWIPAKLGGLANATTSFWSFQGAAVFAGIGAVSGLVMAVRFKRGMIRTFRTRRVS